MGFRICQELSEGPENAIAHLFRYVQGAKLVGSELQDLFSQNGWEGAERCKELF